MSNFQCESCGAVYIDNGITGYETKQCKTTADVIKGLNERIVLLQNMNKSLNELLSIKDEAITDLTADKIELKEQLCSKEKELCNAYMEVNAANTAAAGNLSLSQLAEDKLQAAVNQYNAVVQQNKELQQELIQKNNKLMGKDAKIASMAIGCEPVIMEAACSFVNSLYTLFETEKTTIFNFSEGTIAELKKIGRGLQDYQNNKPNPFSDEYFRNLTYSEIAELAKKSIRLTKEHCSDLHKIEELQQECEKLSYNLGTHIMIKNGYCRVLDMIEKYCSNAQDPCQDDWNREREKFAKIILNFISKVKGGKNE